MSSLLRIVVSAVLVIGVVVYAKNKYNATIEEHEYRLAKEQLRAEFLERAPFVWSISDPDRYREESRSLFNWYYGELTNLYSRFPAYKNEDKYLQELEERRAAGRIRDSEFAEYKASYEQVNEIWKLIREGRYAPALTASDASMRIDFLEFERTMVQGQPALQGRFVLWGAQRRRVEERRGEHTLKRVDVQASFPDVQLRLTGSNGKPVAEASFGMPSGPYVPYPEQRVEDFPPMAYIGTFALPVLPHEAVEMEMEAAAISRSTSGGDIHATFVWKQEVPSSWKLREGEEWEGAEVETREELR